MGAGLLLVWTEHPVLQAGWLPPWRAGFRAWGHWLSPLSSTTMSALMISVLLPGLHSDAENHSVSQSLKHASNSHGWFSLQLPKPALGAQVFMVLDKQPPTPDESSACFPVDPPAPESWSPTTFQTSEQLCAHYLLYTSLTEIILWCFKSSFKW